MRSPIPSSTPSTRKGHSLSTGDIVVFRQDGKQTAYYVDEGAD
ncbi:MAG: YodL domain-containing protein, partial [Faecalibacterium sp.]